MAIMNISNVGKGDNYGCCFIVEVRDLHGKTMLENVSVLPQLILTSHAFLLMMSYHVKETIKCSPIHKLME